MIEGTIEEDCVGNNINMNLFSLFGSVKPQNLFRRGKMEMTDSGIESLGEVKWGSHFCHFYDDNLDLSDALVPFFKAGLQNNEQCLWITAEPLLAHEAEQMLRKSVPNLKTYLDRGQLEIYNFEDWYLRQGSQNADAVLSSWIKREQLCLEQGRKGLRLTGNTFWLERENWRAFSEYEAKVNENFVKHRIVGLCSYCLSKTTSQDVFDVVRNHDFALLRDGGTWELLESVRNDLSKNHLNQLSVDLKENLRKAKQVAESASRLKTDFLAHMSHEIRTPLGAIVGFADLLRDEKTTELDRETYLSAIERNGRSLSKLVDDILDLSKIEADSLIIEKVSFEPLPLIDELATLFVPLAKPKNIDFKVFVDANLPKTCHSDPLRVKQVLVNLINNALKFTDAGEVRIIFECFEGIDKSTMIRVLVADSGLGIPKDQQENLFLPFSQGDGSITKRFGGTGLGLYVSKRLAHLLGGNVYLKSSEEGEGSVFVATFQADLIERKDLPEQALSPALDGETPKEKIANSVGKLSGFRVLLVEDNFDNQILVSSFLRSTGVNLSIASNGKEGVEKCQSQDFDTILMDLQMPVMDGYKALMIIRERGYRGPVLALTAYAMKDEKERALQSGFDEHMSKPLNRETLISTLERFLKKH